MKVIAIESIKDGLMKSYGEGEYIGDKEPDGGWMKDTGIKNPCIKLDNGNFIWGFQCWWGEVEKFNEKYRDGIKETIIIEVPEIINPK
tara:strand:+ start:1582 stop:1845 length:264 start_codon:yes stop_codon:yes gene_type:complete